MLEMPNEETFALLKKESVRSKPVPVATVPSSKLRAMAANINESHDIEQDIDVTENSADVEDYIEASGNDASMIKLEDILIVPEIINSNIQSIVENKNSDIKGLNQANEGFYQNDDRVAYTASDTEQHNKNGRSTFLQKEKNYVNTASTSSSKDELSLSCVNSSEANYRLEPT